MDQDLLFVSLCIEVLLHDTTIASIFLGLGFGYWRLDGRVKEKEYCA